MPLKRYSVWTGPTIVKQVAQAYRHAGALDVLIGTETVYFTTDDLTPFVGLISGFRLSDFRQLVNIHPEKLDSIRQDIARDKRDR